jgi:hypothetical protein
LISGLTEQINDLVKQRDLAKTQEEVNLITGKIDLLKEELNLVNAIAKRANTPVDAGIDTSGIPERDGSVAVKNPALSAGINLILPVEQLTEDAQKIVDANQIISDSFGALGTQVANSLGIANNGLRGFISLVLSSAPKIISAIIQQANASKAANASIIAGNAQVAGSEAIASGAKAANALGPVGLALLPVFIGGALALIAGAFSKIGGSKGGISGGGGGGGIPGGGGVPKTFSNAGANVPGSFNPDLAGFGSGFNAGGGKLTAEISGDSLIFVLERAQEKKNRS